MEPLLFDQIMKLGNSEVIYNYFVDKTLELLKKINEYKKFPYKEHEKKTNTIKSLGCNFDNTTIMFKEVSTLVYNLGYFRVNDLESQSQIIIESFNNLLINYNKYVSIYNELLENDYNLINDDLMNKYINLFRDMLSYKDKYYGDRDDIYKLYERVRLCYYDFSYLLDDIYTAIKSGVVVVSNDKPVVKLDTIEYIYLLRNNYETISSQYKNYEEYSSEIDLKEGQSIQDLINIIDKKINTLYEKIINKEMTSMSDFNKKIISSKETLEDKFIYLHNEYSEDVYKIRSIEEDNQLIYYFKNDLYNRIKNDFNLE